MKVVILAGGFGTRISEESIIKPKPLVEIGDKPILWHIMKIYSYYGFNEFIICLGYKGNLIKEYFYNFDFMESDVTFNFQNGFSMTKHNGKAEPWKVTLVDTGINTMTGGRLKRIQPYIDEDEEFMFTYGDGVSNVNINDLIKAHRCSGRLVTLTGVKPLGRFGKLILEGDKISEFREKEVESNEWINAGFFIANKKIFDYIEGDNTVLEKDPLINIAKDGQLGMYKHNGFWQPMDTLKEKIDLDKIWSNGDAPWKIWSN